MDSQLRQFTDLSKRNVVSLQQQCPCKKGSHGNDSGIIAKISRMRSGGRPRVLDLFSGCGGFSLGFSSAGFQIVGGVEIDPEAAVSHAMNFHGITHPLSKKDGFAYVRDIRYIEPEEIVMGLGSEKTDEAVDVLIGGPPCQSYARVGRSKLREVLEHPDAYRVDPRGNLYLRYLDYVRALKPLIIVMENVPDVLNYGGHNVAEETAEVLAELGYDCRYTLLNSVFYGVPQMRERMFLIAYHRELKLRPSFPEPSHYYDLPRGYHGARQVALKHHSGKGSVPDEGFKYYVHPPVAAPDLPSAVTAEQALGDLLPITYHLKIELKRGMRRPVEAVRYRQMQPSGYAVSLRSWKGFNESAGILDHVIRHLPRDYRIFKRMRHGDQYPQAHEVAIRLFDQSIRRAERKGCNVKRNSAVYRELWSKYVPPYDPGKFPNKWRKMEPDQPARTVMAHLGKDSYSHIHYDSDQARTISVREAARLQSFPDGFFFYGAMNASFRQIGNAVPPLLARAIAGCIYQDAIQPLRCKNDSVIFIQGKAVLCP